MYASGRNSWGRCQKCGDRVKYQELVADGQNPGLRVCQSCRDIKHPAERPFRTDEGIALKRPSPDTDDDTGGSPVDVTGTATAGAATTITLQSTASAQTDAYINSTITLTGGTGSGQERTILDYDGPTRVATVATWTTTPDATTTYSVAVPLLSGRLFGSENVFGGAT